MPRAMLGTNDCNLGCIALTKQNRLSAPKELWGQGRERGDCQLGRNQRKLSEGTDWSGDRTGVLDGGHAEMRRQGRPHGTSSGSHRSALPPWGFRSVLLNPALPRRESSTQRPALIYFTYFFKSTRPF